MVHSFAARPRAAGWSTKAWSQGIPYLVHVGNLKRLGTEGLLGVEAGPDRLETSLPLFPDNRTSSDRPGWSVQCQQRK
jgi:hypothetical protein